MSRDLASPMESTSCCQDHPDKTRKLNVIRFFGTFSADMNILINVTLDLSDFITSTVRWANQPTSCMKTIFF